jgi:hypothetical protein
VPAQNEAPSRGSASALVPPQYPFVYLTSPVRVRYPSDSNHSAAVCSRLGSRPTENVRTRASTPAARDGSGVISA